MTAPEDGQPYGYRSQLLSWWDGVNQDRSGNNARCATCDIDTDLVLIWKGEAGQVIYWHDLVALCRRCGQLVDQVLADRGSPGGRWYGMPRSLAVESAVLHVLQSGEHG